MIISRGIICIFMLIILLDHNAQHLPLSLSLRLNDGWTDGDVIVTNLPHIWVNYNLHSASRFALVRSSSQQVSIMSPSRVTNLDKLDYELPRRKKRWVKTWGNRQE